MSRFLVTGGAGFIGSHLTKRLLAEGHNVTVVDDLFTGKKENIPQGADFIKWTILDLHFLTKIFNKVDYIFHLAAISSVPDSMKDPFLTNRINVEGTLCVLVAAKEADVKKVIFTSSSTVYGERISDDNNPILLREDDLYLKPCSVYGLSKLIGEQYCKLFSEIATFRVDIHRLANIIGIGASKGVIYDFIQKLRENPKELEILGNGHQTKPYLLVEDCVDAMLYTTNITYGEKFSVYNLGCITSTSVNRIAEIVIEEMGISGVRLRYTGGMGGWSGDIPEVYYDMSKMKRLGWEPRHSSDEAVRIAVRSLLL